MHATICWHRNRCTLFKDGLQHRFCKKSENKGYCLPVQLVKCHHAKYYNELLKQSCKGDIRSCYPNVWLYALKVIPSNVVMRHRYSSMKKSMLINFQREYSQDDEYEEGVYENEKGNPKKSTKQIISMYFLQNAAYQSYFQKYDELELFTDEPNK